MRKTVNQKEIFGLSACKIPQVTTVGEKFKLYNKSF